VKLESSLFAGIFVIAASLLARVQMQGLDAALASVAIENGIRAMRAGSRVLRSTLYWIV
jgi:hypothetical protein